ncbi:MAG TPA: diguanylate cyclase [Anaerolineales bacterium]|nr:diguanylate cyclase [Anaerolineales bacterium]
MDGVVAGLDLTDSPDQILVDIHNLRDAAWQVRFKDSEKSLRILSQLEEWIRASDLRANKFQSELADVLFTHGKIVFTHGDYYTALNRFSESLALVNVENDMKKIGQRTKLIGRTLAYLQSYSAALSEMFHTLQIAQKLKDSALEGEVLSDIGYTYTAMREPLKGLSYLQQSYDVLVSVEDPILLAGVLDHMCFAYMITKEFDKALGNGRKAQALFKKNEAHQAQTKTLLRLGSIYMETDQTGEAIKIFREVVEITNMYPFYQERGLALCRLAQIQIKSKLYASAKEHIEASLYLAKKYHLVSGLVMCHKLLSELYHRQNEYKQAFRHYKKYHAAVQQIHKLEEANRVKVIELSGTLETARKVTGALQMQNEALRKEVKLRKKIQMELEEISRRDSLTGIYNRRYFFEQAEREIQAARRYGYPVSAIMIDLDHFKEVNDTHGHLVGDQVLMEVAQRILDNTRSVDIAGRYGGEEFVVLLPQTNLEEALVTANRIWNSLTVRPMDTRKLTLQVNASLGVACFNAGTALSLDELLERADQALYQAKEKGRNRVESSPEK